MIRNWLRSLVQTNFSPTIVTILICYFFLGTSTLTSVASTLFAKSYIHLSPVELMSLGIWTNLPWSCKLLFSSVIDRVKIAGSQRKSYLVFATLLGIISFLGFAECAIHGSIILAKLGEYKALLILGLASTISTVIMRLLFDSLVVEEAKNDDQKAKLQLYSRNVYIAGGLAGAILSGILATHFSVATVFLIAAISSIIILVCVLLGQYSSVEPSLSILYPSVAVGYVLSILLINVLFTGDVAQVIIFIGSLALFTGLLYYKLPHLEFKNKTAFFITLLALFLFRTNPNAGVGATWYYMDVQGFDPMFLGLLSTVGYGISVLSMILFKDFLVKKENLIKTLIYTSIGMLILGLPDLMVYYHYTFGISARHLILLDSAGADALAQLGMIPLGIIVAFNAPEEGKVTYFALTASLMNLALVASGLIQKYLNSIFVVSRGHYENLGQLFIWSLVVSTGLSIIGVVLLKITEKRT